jgi:hypothetical protein
MMPRAIPNASLTPGFAERNGDPATIGAKENQTRWFHTENFVHAVERYVGGRTHRSAAPL